MASGYVEGPDTSGWSKNPSKYPFPVGSKYQGEDPTGYWIYSADDTYYPNQQVASDYNQNAGITKPPPKQPGMWEQVAPLAAGATALGLASGFAKDPKGFVGGVADSVTGLFGMGKPKPTDVVSNAAQQATTAAGPTAATTGAAFTPASAASAYGPGGATSAPFAGIGPALPVPAAPVMAGGTPAYAGGSGLMGSTFAAGAEPTLLGSTTAGAFLPAAGIAAGAATGYAQATGIKDLATGNKMDWKEAAALALPTFGLSLLGPFVGHSKNYTDGKTREKMLNKLGGLNAPTAAGTNYTVTPEQFRKDPNTYKYDQAAPSMAEDIGAGQAIAFSLTGKKPGDKGFNDMTGLFANAHKNGVDAQTLASQYGQNYNTIRASIESGDISRQIKDSLLNGLDQSFHVNAWANGAKPNAVIPAAGAQGGAAAGTAAGAQRVSPGVWKDAKGQYNSKSGVRGG